MPVYNFLDRTAQFDCEEGNNQALLDSSGNGNNLNDSLSVPGGATGIIGDARGTCKSGDRHFETVYVADNAWDIRGATSCTMAGWFQATNTEQSHVFSIDDRDGANAAGQAFVMVLRETNTGVNPGPWVFMGDGATRFVGASFKVNDAVSISTSTWQFFAGGYNATTNKLFGFWGKSAGVSYYKEATGVVGGFGYVGTNTSTLFGKFNGEAGTAEMLVDHCLWWNGRALTEEELGIVWNNHAAISFNELSGSTGVLDAADVTAPHFRRTQRLRANRR